MNKVGIDAFRKSDVAVGGADSEYRAVLVGITAFSTGNSKRDR